MSSDNQTRDEGALIAEWETAKEVVTKAIENVQSLKEKKAEKAVIMTAVGEMKQAKENVTRLEKLLFPPDKLDIDRDAFDNLLLRRFFICPSFSIYGGAKGFYDFGPPGCAIKNNLLAFWRQFFVLEENMLEIDTATVTPEHVLEASGHVKKFNDFTIKDLTTGAYHRADHLLEDFIGDLLKAPGVTPEKAQEYRAVIKLADEYTLKQLTAVMKKYSVVSPDGNPISDPFKANLMLETSVGRGTGGKSYLRPETAQGIFVNFGRLLEFNGNKLPFAAATVGLAYRNEIAPRSGLLRVREFTLAEIEHFVYPDDKSHPKFDSVRNVKANLLSAERQNRVVPSPIVMTVGDALENGIVQNETVAYFIGRVQLFMEAIGIKKEGLMFRQHRENEMAHYAQDCWDAEILTSYGWIEAMGIADRSCFDLTKHAEGSGARMTVFRSFSEPREVEEVQMTIQKSAIGKTFKKEAKPLIAHLTSLTQEQTVSLQENLAKGPFDVVIGETTFSVTSEMAKFKNVKKKLSGENIVPSVVEPSFGIGRILYCLLEHSFYARDDVRRTVVGLSPVIAPVKCSVLPLQQNAKFVPLVQKVSTLLTNCGISNKVDDVGQSIGKRYARTDEIGIPFGITVDFDTLSEDENGQSPTVTLRDRDSTSQVRIPIDELTAAILSIMNGSSTWKDVTQKYPTHTTSDE